MPAANNRLVVDGYVVSSIASRLTAMSDRFNSAYAALKSGTDSHYHCWGTSDDFAKTFDNDYTQNSKDIIDASEKLKELFGQLGQAVKVMDASFATTEQANT